jgi:hypothetical protein
MQRRAAPAIGAALSQPRPSSGQRCGSRVKWPAWHLTNSQFGPHYAAANAGASRARGATSSRRGNFRSHAICICISANRQLHPITSSGETRALPATRRRSTTGNTTLTTPVTSTRWGRHASWYPAQSIARRHAPRPHDALHHSAHYTGLGWAIQPIPRITALTAECPLYPPQRPSSARLNHALGTARRCKSGSSSVPAHWRGAHHRVALTLPVRRCTLRAREEGRFAAQRHVLRGVADLSGRL